MSQDDHKELLEKLRREQQERERANEQWKDSSKNQQESYQPTKSELDDDNPPEDD